MHICFRNSRRGAAFVQGKQTHPWWSCTAYLSRDGVEASHKGRQENTNSDTPQMHFYSLSKILLADPQPKSLRQIQPLLCWEDINYSSL